MNTVTAYFADTMVDSLIEQGVNIININDSDMPGQKLVEISVTNSSELYKVFSAGYHWAKIMKVGVGS